MGWKNSGNARAFWENENTKQRQNSAHVRELLINHTVRMIELELGIADQKIDCETRKRIMLLLNKLANMCQELQAYAEELTIALEEAMKNLETAQAEIDRLEKELAEQEKENERLLGLIAQLEQQLAESDGYNEGLRNTIEQLKNELAQKTSRKGKKSSKAYKPAKERMEEVERKLEACKRKQERLAQLEEELKAAAALEEQMEDEFEVIFVEDLSEEGAVHEEAKEDLDAGTVPDAPEDSTAQMPPEGGEAPAGSDSANGGQDDEAACANEEQGDEAACANKEEEQAESTAEGDPGSQDNAPMPESESPAGKQDEQAPTESKHNQEFDESVEKLKEQLEALKEKMKEKDERIEELIFESQKTTQTSNVPPRARGYKETMSRKEKEANAAATEGVTGSDTEASGPGDSGEQGFHAGAEDGGGGTTQSAEATGGSDAQQNAEATDGSDAQQKAGKQGSSTEHVETEEEKAEREEREACEAARKDTHKSPNRKKTGKRGKPVGSAGGGRKMPEIGEFRVVPCEPSECAKCPHHDECMQKAKRGPIRRRFDIVVHRVAEEMQTLTCSCPLRNGEEVSGSYPEGVNSTFNFGNMIRSLCVLMSTLGMVSYRRTAEIVGGLIDVEISQSAIMNWVELAGKKAVPVSDLIKAAVLEGDYGHFDETGIKVKGVLHWIHTSCNMNYTYLRVHPKRGNEAVEDIGILPFFKGTAITDCWSTYWKIGTKHGLCNAHLLRELLALIKFFEKDKEWAQKMNDLFVEMNDKRNALKAKGKTCFDKKDIEDFEGRYDKIVEEGLAKNPLKLKEGTNARAKQTKARNLLERLKSRKENFLLFIHDFDTPFTNNCAERSFRMVSEKRSIIGGFNTLQGAEDFCYIWTFVSSARKQGVNAFMAVNELLDGKGAEVIFDPEDITRYTKLAEEQATKEADRKEEQRKEAEAKEAKKKTRKKPKAQKADGAKAKSKASKSPRGKAATSESPSEKAATSESPNDKATASESPNDKAATSDPAANDDNKVA